MSKKKIINFAKYENKVIYFKLVNEPNLNIPITSFFKELGFNNVNELDLYYPELSESYIFINDKKFSLHIFVTEKYVNLVIEGKLSLSKIYPIAEKYFIFP